MNGHTLGLDPQTQKVKLQHTSFYPGNVRINAKLLCIIFVAFRTMVLALECESYDLKCQASDSTATVNTTCSSLQRCDHTPGKVPACFALFGRNNQGELSVVKKGCAENSGPNCGPSSGCSVQERRSSEASPSAFYCCCTEDRCNRDVILFVTEAKEECSGEFCRIVRLQNSQYIYWLGALFECEWSLNNCNKAEQGRVGREGQSRLR